VLRLTGSLGREEGLRVGRPPGQNGEEELVKEEGKEAGVLDRGMALLRTTV
jgi:hypothetical protein